MLTQANAGPLPWAGTPAWCQLSDRNPRKLLSLAVAGVHHMLRVETAQAAIADASREISAAANWPAIAGQIRARAEFYATRPWLRRAAQ